jgi:membrane peptidoglycan carboxypeptidase
VYVSYFLPLSVPPLASSSIIEDIHGSEIGEIVADESIRHREILFSDIPEFYTRSLVWLEDRSFWQNNGLSIRGILRSTVRNIEAGKVIE